MWLQNPIIHIIIIWEIIKLNSKNEIGKEEKRKCVLFSPHKNDHNSLLAQSFPLLSQNHNRFISVFPILPLFTISSCDVSCGGVGKSLSYMHSHIDISIYIRSLSLSSLWIQQNLFLLLPFSSTFLQQPSAMAGFGGGHCFPYPLFAVIIVLAIVHAILASIATVQVIFFSIFVYFFWIIWSI